MLQLGWLVASATVALTKSAASQSRKAPPEAVSWMRRRPGVGMPVESRAVSAQGVPWRHWKMAECSESAGSSREPERASSGSTTGPAAIRVSLLARARSLPARIAARVGSRPAQPTMPVTTKSAVGQAAATQRPSGPPSNSGKGAGRSWGSRASSRSRRVATRSPSARATTSGRWRRIWPISRSRLRPAVRATTRKRSGKSSTISRVWVPIEPVDPSTLRAFTGGSATVRPVSHRGRSPGPRPAGSPGKA